MKEQAQQMFWIHDRGLMVTLPSHATDTIGHAVANGDLIPTTESQRLRLVANDGIMKKRFPTSEDGLQYMQRVNYERRDVLLSHALELSDHIVEEWNKINPNKQIAIVLYGSIARSLTKGTEDPDPSDIDVTVIGDLTDGECLTLRKNIHQKREELREVLASACPNLGEEIRNDIRYAGALVQNTEKLKKNDYSSARNYIGSCARALYDPSGIWEQLEEETLKFTAEKKSDEMDKSSRRSEYKKIRAFEIQKTNPEVIIFKTRKKAISQV